MTLTLEEMEREAYQRGDSERAELLRLAIERQAGAADEMEGLEQEAESERERADSAETAIDDLQACVGKQLSRLEDALEINDLETVRAAIDKIREEL